MSVDMERRIFAQHLVFDWITKVVINYKKLANANVNYVTTKKQLDTLDAQWEKAQTLHSTIDYEATEEDRKTLSYFIQDHYAKAEDAFDEAADFLVIKLAKLKNAGISEHEDSTDSFSFEATKLLSSQLPRINLPKFSGEFSEWKNFRNTFEALIGSNDEITDILKLYYLKSCVSDTVAKLINDLSMSDDDYPSAWKILMNAYENKRHETSDTTLIQSHLESLVCFPPMKSENPIELKKLRDTVTATRAALTNLGLTIPVEHWDEIIVSIMSLKFSLATRREWNKSLEKSREYASYEKMQKFLTVYIHELSDTTKAPVMKTQVYENTGLVKARGRSRPSVHSTSVSTCVNCSGSHNLTTCEDFLSKSITQRNALVKRKHVCFNCLRPGHFTSTCLSRSRCIHCHRIHHTLLHRAAVTAETPVDRELEVDDSSRMVSHASSTRVTNIQSMQAEVAPVGVLPATAWIDPNPSEGRCFRVLRILSVLKRRFVWKSSETQDSIYGHVGPCIRHSRVNRLDKNPFAISRRFVILAFGCYCCLAILIGLSGDYSSAD